MTMFKAQTICKSFSVGMRRRSDNFVLFRHKHKSILTWIYYEHKWSKMWRYLATPCFPQNVVMGIRWRCLPLAGESGQTPAAVAFVGAVPSVEAAVVPSCAHAGGGGEVRKPDVKKSSKCQAKCSCRRVVGFATEALTGWLQCTMGFLGLSHCKRPGWGSVSHIRIQHEIWDVNATLHASWKHWDFTMIVCAGQTFFFLFFNFWATMGCDGECHMLRTGAFGWEKKYKLIFKT